MGVQSLHIDRIVEVVLRGELVVLEHPIIPGHLFVHVHPRPIIFNRDLHR